MGILVIIFTLIGHLIADFVFQSSDNIINKGNKMVYVSKHAAEYSTVISAFVLIMLLLMVIPTVSWYFIINFWVFTFVFHFIVDYYTSILTKKTWENRDRVGNFSIVILDQSIHMIILFLTLNYLFY